MSLIDFYLVVSSAWSWEFWVSSSAKCGRYYSRVLLRTIERESVITGNAEFMNPLASSSPILTGKILLKLESLVVGLRKVFFQSAIVYRELSDHAIFDCQLIRVKCKDIRVVMGLWMLNAIVMILVFYRDALSSLARVAGEWLLMPLVHIKDAATHLSIPPFHLLSAYLLLLYGLYKGDTSNGYR